jgi:hypothetical protein
MIYDIRAEMPNGNCEDFKVSAAPGDRITAIVRAEEVLKQKYLLGPAPMFRWRGMVVFVNREVPLS